jgi:hypothetical protein
MLNCCCAKNAGEARCIHRIQPSVISFQPPEEAGGDTAPGRAIAGR